MKAPVVFDCDGVLADFYSGYKRVASNIGKPAPVVGRWDDFWDKDVWAAIKASDSFWLGLPPLATKRDFARINVLCLSRDVYFATSRPGYRTREQSARWLGDRGIDRPSVVVTHRKGEFAKVVDAEFLIDDKAGNAVYTAYESPTTKVFLLDAVYNQFDQSVVGSKVNRIKTVAEFLDIVEAA